MLLPAMGVLAKEAAGCFLRWAMGVLVKEAAC
jgi:hypothetical protein